MFGAFRYLLASMVVLTHLWPAQSMWWGVYAVFCFYLVSGYLMTLVLDRTYPYSTEGMSRYAANRILRIYPPYLVVCLLALLLIHFLPEFARMANPRLRWPAYGQQWLSSLLIFGQLGSSQALVPPAWSLNVELVFYVLMGVVLSRRRWIIVGWFVASVAYTLWQLQTPLDFNARYREIPGASLPFALGAMIYAFRERLTWIGPRSAPVSAALFLANVALAAWAPVFSPLVLHFYLSLLFGGGLLVALAQVRPGDLPRWAVRLDRIGGNLSYPIFLCHFHVAAVLLWLGFERSRSGEDIGLWAASFALTNLAAWALYVGVDQNVDRLRDRVRRRRSSRDVAHGLVAASAGEHDPERVGSLR